MSQNEPNSKVATAISPTASATSTSPDLKPAKTIDDFPKPTRQHILNCSYESWYKLYKSVTPKARVIPLTQSFVDYLGEDGIVLPNEDNNTQTNDLDSGVFSNATDDADDEDEYEDPTYRFPEIHETVKRTIIELGGNVYPKLNWSAPKDAAFILGNSVKCSSASDVYLLLKSSDFISHDLEHAFDDTSEVPGPDGKVLGKGDIKYHLVLRKWVEVITSVEFRCFVRGRKLLGVSQRDMNHYAFLDEQKFELMELIMEFFEEKLQDTFPDPDFIFDVYIPKTQTTASRVWLIDINPYATRTDPLLYSFTELLNIDADAADFEPELRIVGKNDPEAYNFNTSQYSAHKLPKEVVDAGVAGPEGIADFATRWREIVEGLDKADIQTHGADEDSSDDEVDEKAKTDGTGDASKAGEKKT